MLARDKHSNLLLTFVTQVKSFIALGPGASGATIAGHLKAKGSFTRPISGANFALNQCVL
jgi:hypothetical protein